KEINLAYDRLHARLSGSARSLSSNARRPPDPERTRSSASQTPPPASSSSDARPDQSSGPDRRTDTRSPRLESEGRALIRGAAITLGLIVLVLKPLSDVEQSKAPVAVAPPQESRSRSAARSGSRTSVPSASPQAVSVQHPDRTFQSAGQTRPSKEGD